MPSCGLTAGLGGLGAGAATSRVRASATAFPHCPSQHDLVILSQWSDPADSERNIAWTRGLFEALLPHLEKAVFRLNHDIVPSGMPSPTNVARQRRVADACG